MTENEMTFLELDKAQEITLADFFYLIQGSGENRDTLITVKQLRDFLQSRFTQIDVLGNYGRCELKNGSIAFIASEQNSAKLSYNSGLELVTSNYTFKADNSGVEYDGKEFSFQNDSNGFIFKKDGLFVKVSPSGINFGSQGGSQQASIYYNQGKFSISGQVDFSSAVNVNGIATFNNLCQFENTAIFNGTLDSEGSANLDGTATFKNGLNISSGGMSVNGNVAVNGRISGRYCIPVYDNFQSLPANGVKGEIGAYFYNQSYVIAICNGLGTWYGIQ